ncbi:hypothetical protein [Mycolicibacterium neoaurum]|uniref:Uncharacterized protein n=1 Tax=Mycolicibacterium neoaurum TaxID=1795 RepID=A0AAV2WDT5_MYCNE|nr:hypothetical protein [Mycolicibacterium neoaurum]CDQ42419.1 hypothetical protein BN1047_00271 [Mycolicibacterium neoaurum]
MAGIAHTAIGAGGIPNPAAAAVNCSCVGRIPGLRRKNTQPSVSARTRAANGTVLLSSGRDVVTCSPPLRCSRKPPSAPVASIGVVTPVKDTSIPSSTSSPAVRTTVRLSARGVIVAPLAVSGWPSAAVPGRIETAPAPSVALGWPTAPSDGFAGLVDGPYEQPARTTDTPISISAIRARAIRAGPLSHRMWSL